MNQFKKGGEFGIELSSMNNYKIIKKTIKLLNKNKIQADRFDECRGMMRLPENEIKDILKITKDNNIGMIFSIGPRAIYSSSGFVRSENGKRMGYRLHGKNQVENAIDELKRGIDLGVKGFLIYDEGFLDFANQLRKSKQIPEDIIFKLSVHVGCANQFSARVYENLGADTINVVPDLSIEDLYEIRKMVSIPLDIFTDTASAAGGLIRTYDVGQIIEYVSPIYFKCGPSSQQEQNHLPTDNELEERVKQTKIITEFIRYQKPEAKQMNHYEKTRVYSR